MSDVKNFFDFIKFLCYNIYIKNKKGKIEMKNKNYTYIVCRNKETGEPTGTVIAISRYAGKPVRGVAKCNPGDEFDIEFGKNLASARCNLKIAQKRNKRASEKYLEAVAERNKANERLQKMKNYFCDSKDACDEAAELLRSVLVNF